MSTYVHIHGHQAIFTFSERYQFLMLWKHQKMRSFETGKGETEDESQKQPNAGRSHTCGSRTKFERVLASSEVEAYFGRV
jgi:hypothetical protein